MLLEILGCHGGSVPRRRLPSFLINGHVLLEAGSVTSALPLGAQASIEHVLVTHAHLDHTVGLAFLVDNIQSTQTAAGHNAAVTAASIGPVVDDLRTHCFNNRLWPDFTKLPRPEEPALRLHTLREREAVEVRAADRRAGPRTPRSAGRRIHHPRRHLGTGLLR